MVWADLNGCRNVPSVKRVKAVDGARLSNRPNASRSHNPACVHIGPRTGDPSTIKGVQGNGERIGWSKHEPPFWHGSWATLAPGTIPSRHSVAAVRSWTTSLSTHKEGIGQFNRSTRYILQGRRRGSWAYTASTHAHVHACARARTHPH